MNKIPPFKSEKDSQDLVNKGLDENSLSMGREWAQKKEDQPSLDKEFFKNRTSNVSKTERSFITDTFGLPLRINALNALAIAYRTNPKVEIWEKWTIQLANLIDEFQDYKAPKRELIYFLIDHCLSTLRHDDSPSLWQEKLSILNDHITTLNKIDRISTKDVDAILKRFRGRGLNDLFKMEEYLTALPIKNYLFEEVFTKDVKIERYFDYVTRNMNKKGWKLFQEVMNFIPSRGKKRQNMNLYRQGIAILLKKAASMDKALFAKVKPLFGEGLWNSLEAHRELDLKYYSLRTLEERINYIYNWNKENHIRHFAENLKITDFRELLELMRQKSDLAFSGHLAEEILKYQPQFLFEIPPHGFGEELRNELFMRQWRADARLPNLNTFDTQDPKWRSNAIRSTISLVPPESSFDFIASWIWFDKEIFKETMGLFSLDQIKDLGDLILKHAQRKPENYLNMVQLVNEVHPEFRVPFSGVLSKNPLWKSDLRDKIINLSFHKIDLNDSFAFVSYFPSIFVNSGVLERRFEDRRQLPGDKGIDQYVGVEIESGALSALPAINPAMKAKDASILRLLSYKFIESSILFQLNVAIDDGKRIRLADNIKDRIQNLKEFPDDLVVLSLGTSSHAIMISFFKPSGSSSLSMVITNTGLGVDKHTKDPETGLHSVSEEVIEIPLDSFQGEKGKLNLFNLLKMRFQNIPLAQQEKEFYEWVEKVSCKPFPDRRNETEFYKLYPKRHAQYGGSCVVQSARQANKYLITRLLWENKKSALQVNENDFWDCYVAAQIYMSCLDSLILSNYPLEKAYFSSYSKVVKKGVATFVEISRNETAYEKSSKALVEASKRTGGHLYSLPRGTEKKPNFLKLKICCKHLVSTWQDLGYTPEKVEKDLQGINDPIIEIAKLRFNYKFDAVKHVQEIWEHACLRNLLDLTQLTIPELDFIIRTLNQWPEKIAEGIGKQIAALISKKQGSYVGDKIKEFGNGLKGNRFYYLFSPLVLMLIEAVPPFSGRHEVLDNFLSKITPQQRREVSDKLVCNDPFKLQLRRVLNEVVTEEPFDFPIAKQRFLLYLSVRLRDRERLQDIEMKALQKIIPCLSDREKEELLEPFITVAKQEAEKNGRRWFIMDSSEREAYINAQIQKAG